MGGKLMAFSILGSTALLEHWSIEKAKLRVLECGLQDFSFVFDLVLAVFNPKSELRNRISVLAWNTDVGYARRRGCTTPALGRVHLCGPQWFRIRKSEIGNVTCAISEAA
jgi:hypothetical protein